MGTTYRESGVDIDKGDRFVEIIKKKVSEQEKGNIGLFGGIFDLGKVHYKDPVLVASTDGVGTKLLLAKTAKRYETIGIDLVAMCVNDVVTLGAKPLFFLDYIATSELDLEQASQVIDGIIEGCKKSNCLLLGGETAEMPGVYQKGDYELAGFACGIVEREDIIDGRGIRASNVLIGVRSSGIHSNGLSLARKVLFEVRRYPHNFIHPLLGHTLVEELLIPTRIYVNLILKAVKKISIKGIAHITGGGIYGNTRRLLPEGLNLKIFWDDLRPQKIFQIIQDEGDVLDEEMRKTFNLGIGLVFFVDTNSKNHLISFLKDMGEEPLIVGEVERA